MRAPFHSQRCPMLLRVRFFVLALSFVVAMPAFATDPAAPQPPAEPAAPTAPAGAAQAETPASAASNAAPAEPASAQADYIAATWADLLRTAVRFNAIDLNDDKLIDEYAAITDCDIYKFYFKDDFKWQEVRKKTRESAALNSANYPTHYYMRAVLHLGRYDFGKKIYSFTDDTAIHAVNVFKLFQFVGPHVCTDRTYIKYIPAEFHAVAAKPFTLLGIPLSPTDAQSLLRLMNADKNTDRQIIAKFDMTITYVARLHKDAINPGTTEKDAVYKQLGESHAGAMRMDAQVDSIEFYEDPEMTKLIYSTKPST